MENIVIIGSGCAGWTAAIYAARANLSPLVITGTQPGGLLTTTSTVENYPGFPDGVEGTELMVRMQQQAERFGARTEYGTTITRVDFCQRPFLLWADERLIEARAVIVATGALPRRLGLPSETALERKGVTYCATCDGALPMFRNQPLVVVGGGDSACEEAHYLTHFASKVYIVHRRNALRASKIMAERVLHHPKIEMVWDAVVEEILDTAQNKVTAVRLRNVKSNTVRELPCAGVFVAIGHVPNTELFRGQLELDSDGYIVCRRATQTSVEGVFAAGDCVDRTYRQAVTAAGSGCAAAIDAERWLSSQH
ncbi:MAG: thioredoxin-disulfide reductase [Verrucomicrobiae bacterium]|nr:thioredoxin-disulfide reductase [Verrucomicrobiae bacterium]